MRDINNSPQMNITNTTQQLTNDNSQTDNRETEKTTIKLFYKNQMTNNYKQVENELKRIIDMTVTGKNNNEIKLFIYYKNKKLKKSSLKITPMNQTTPHTTWYTSTFATRSSVMLFIHAT